MGLEKILNLEKGFNFCPNGYSFTTISIVVAIVVTVTITITIAITIIGIDATNLHIIY